MLLLVPLLYLVPGVGRQTLPRSDPTTLRKRKTGFTQFSMQGAFHGIRQLLVKYAISCMSMRTLRNAESPEMI